MSLEEIIIKYSYWFGKSCYTLTVSTLLTLQLFVGNARVKTASDPHGIEISLNYGSDIAKWETTIKMT